MTKEELLAEEYICNGKCQDDITRNYVHCKTCTRLKDFLAGYKAGKAELEKENAELKEKVSFLEDNLRVARKDREDLQLDVAKGLKEFVKDYPATAFRYLANEKYVEQLTKAKEIIKKLMEFAEMDDREYEEEYKQAEQFLKYSEVEK